jgi:hypothetical protein
MSFKLNPPVGTIIEESSANRLPHRLRPPSLSVKRGLLGKPALSIDYLLSLGFSFGFDTGGNLYLIPSESLEPIDLISFAPVPGQTLTNGVSINKFSLIGKLPVSHSYSSTQVKNKFSFLFLDEGVVYNGLCLGLSGLNLSDRIVVQSPFDNIVDFQTFVYGDLATNQQESLDYLRSENLTLEGVIEYRSAEDLLRYSSLHKLIPTWDAGTLYYLQFDKKEPIKAIFSEGTIVNLKKEWESLHAYNYYYKAKLLKFENRLSDSIDLGLCDSLPAAIKVSESFSDSTRRDERIFFYSQKNSLNLRPGDRIRVANSILTTGLRASSGSFNQKNSGGLLFPVENLGVLISLRISVSTTGITALGDLSLVRINDVISFGGKYYKITSLNLSSRSLTFSPSPAISTGVYPANVFLGEGNLLLQKGSDPIRTISFTSDLAEVKLSTIVPVGLYSSAIAEGNNSTLPVWVVDSCQYEENFMFISATVER